MDSNPPSTTDQQADTDPVLPPNGHTADAPVDVEVPSPPGNQDGVTVVATGVPAVAHPLEPEEVHLSERTPAELLRMKFSDDDLYVVNGIVARGQATTLLGQGGAGKTRLVLQLLVCLIIGRVFLGWKVTRRKLRCLIIQTENSNRRLHEDLKAMRAWVGEELWPLVDANLVIKTLERDHDSFLSVGEPASAALVARLINKHKADVVVFDPLYAFAAGSLNTDAAMIKTCRAIAQLARRGNPDCSILILHHTITGKAGARKATGYNRASFGRGSKALHFWTRGQINVVPADPQDLSRLVVACGKNSNGLEFAPFGIRLDPDSMVYELDPGFDLEAWESSLHGEAATSVVKPTPESIAALVKDVPLSRKELTVLIMDEFGVGKSRGYQLITQAERQTIRRNGLKQYEVMPR